MRALCTLYLALLLSACVWHHARVRCEGRLQPINVPRPGAQGTAHPPGTP